jgi:phosphoribosylamine-glycine ligase
MTDMNKDHKPVAIVLGGIYPHGTVLDKLKERGYYTVLIDYFDNPPAASHADLHLNESAMAKDAVLRIAKEMDAKLVMSPCLDQQITVAMDVAEELGLSHPFDSQTATNVTNKKYMKTMMLEHGIPTSRYYQVGRDSDLSSLELTYPLIVKPVDGCGAAGVTRVQDISGLPAAVDMACEWSWSNEAIVEEFKAGMEISAYTYVKNGKAKLVTTQNRISFVSDKVIKCYGAVSPADISDKVRDEVEEIATRIAQVFELDTTPLFLQAIIGEDEEISVIEFSPRLGGGTCFRLMEKNAGFDMLDASIDSYLNIVNEQEPVREVAKYLIYQVQAMECYYDHTEGLEELKEEGIISDYFFQKTKGMHVTTEKASSARIAALLVRGDTVEECFGKLQEALRRIKVIDKDGKDVTDRSLVLNAEDVALK